MVCPYCSNRDSGKFHLGFNVRFQTFHCWRCGKQDFVDTMLLLTGLPRSEIYELRKNIPRNTVRKEVRKSRGRYSFAFTPVPMMRQHRKYVLSRNLDPNVLENLWKIQGIGISGEWSWRLFMPVFIEEEAVSWTTRSIHPEATLRYRSASPEEESVSHRTLLFGEHLIQGPAIIVHEGPLDAITTGPGAVATFGTSVSREQINRIAAYPIRVLCFDNQPVAQKMAKKIAAQLSLLPGATYNVKLSGKDANASSREEIAELRHRFLE